MKSLLWFIGNEVFINLSAVLKKESPEEYLALLKMTCDPKNNTSYKSSCGVDPTFKHLPEEGIMNNCPDIMIQRPWKEYMK